MYSFLKERQQQYKEDWSYAVQLNISRIQVKRMGSLCLSYSLEDGYSRSLN